MNKEQEYLIRLTAAYLDGKKISLKNDIDYAKLFADARSHNLFGIAFCAIANSQNKKDVLSEKELDHYQSLFTDIIYNYNLFLKIYGELTDALKGAEIRFVPFKGIVLKDIYPVPEARSMGDIDILIDHDKRDFAKAALTKAGFQCVTSNGPEWAYNKNGICVEIHTSILNGNTGRNSAKEYFADAIDHAKFSGFEGRLDDTYHFEFLFAHLAQHFVDFGAGIRMILDLAAMLKTRDIDIDKVVKDLETAGLGKFAETMLTVCYKWYGYGRDFGLDTQKAENFIAAHGTFGFKDRDLSAVVMRKEFEKGKTGGPVLRKLRLLFPPYGRMRELPYIKFIDGRPYMLPAAWIYRVIYNFINRKNRMMQTAKGLSDKNSENKAKKEFEFFKEIGLN